MSILPFKVTNVDLAHHAFSFHVLLACNLSIWSYLPAPLPLKKVNKTNNNYLSRHWQTDSNHNLISRILNYFQYWLTYFIERWTKIANPSVLKPGLLSLTILYLKRKVTCNVKGILFLHSIIIAVTCYLPRKPQRPIGMEYIMTLQVAIVPENQKPIKW